MMKRQRRRRRQQQLLHTDRTMKESCPVVVPVEDRLKNAAAVGVVGTKESSPPWSSVAVEEDDWRTATDQSKKVEFG